MPTITSHTAEHWSAIFRHTPFSTNFLTKMLWACCCGACLFFCDRFLSTKLPWLHTVGHWNAIFHCAPFFRKFCHKIVAGFPVQWWLLTICLLFCFEIVAVVYGRALGRHFPLRAYFRKFSCGTCGSWLLWRWRLTTLLRGGCWYVVFAPFYA